MKKRILPIPLILLIPIVLLAIVVIAGIYRFSLSDEDILQKFPQHAPLNPIVGQLFNINSSNPLTIDVPENDAFAFISFIDKKRGLAVGQYDSGAERGGVSIDMSLITAMKIEDETFYVSSLAVSNQGTGVFYYLALYRYDSMRDRMILADYEFLGDRIKIDSFVIEEHLAIQANISTQKNAATGEKTALNTELPLGDQLALDNQIGLEEIAESSIVEEASLDVSEAEKWIAISFRTRKAGQAMAKPPTVEKVQRYRINTQFIIEQVLPASEVAKPSK